MRSARPAGSASPRGRAPGPTVNHAAGSSYCARYRDELVHERQEHRLQRRGRSTNRRASTSRRSTRPCADAPLRRRHRAIVEPREHAIGRAGLERAIPEDVRAGEVAAARRLEQLEHRMAVVEEAERGAAARRADRSRAPSVPGSSVGVALRATCCARRARRAGRRRARRTSSSAPPAAGRRKRRVVQDRRRRALSSAGGRDARDRRRPRPGTSASCRSPAPWRDRRLDARAHAVVHDERRDTGRARASARSGTCCRPAADRCRRAPCRGRSASASVNGANVTDADACGATVAVLGLQLVRRRRRASRARRSPARRRGW